MSPSLNEQCWAIGGITCFAVARKDEPLGATDSLEKATTHCDTKQNKMPRQPIRFACVLEEHAEVQDETVDQLPTERLSD